MTNHELYTGVELIAFLRFLAQEGFNPVGASDEELNQIVHRYLKVQTLATVNLDDWSNYAKRKRA